jgi:hypothetical protein
MSRQSSRQFAEHDYFPASVIAPPTKSSNGSAFDVMVTIAGVHRADRVLVVGRSVLHHLLALARLGCRSAAGIDPSFPNVSKDTTDVLWLTEAEQIRNTMAADILRRQRPRMVVIELAATTSLPKLRKLLRDLSGGELVLKSFHRAARRCFAVLHPVQSLQWVA